MSKTITIQCDNVLNISSVKLLLQDLKSMVHDHDVIQLNAEQVERVDLASLQLFASLFHDAEKMGVSVNFESPSTAIKESIEVVGLNGLFKV